MADSMTSDKGPARIALLKDVLHALHIPGGETLGGMAEERIRKRKQNAFDTIIQELAKGADAESSFEEGDLSEFIDMALRLKDAVDKGVAKQNLRLLAQVILGLKKNKLFTFDQFQKWANVLETLTRDEILVLGSAYQIMQRKVHVAAARHLCEGLGGLRRRISAVPVVIS